jgi:two-component system, NtrC family, sensor kinase
MVDARRPRLLIADDREENRYVMSRVLDRAGYDCTHTGTGHGALEIAQTLPEVIILDVNLPDISGYEVCQRIKSDPRTASIPVLQISASFVSSDDRVRALEAGADGYLTHPIDRMVLVATVKALLRLRTAEAVARKAAEQWQSTFNALHEGLALVGSDGSLVRWNKAFAEICSPKVQIEAGQDASLFLDRLVGTSDPLRHNGQGYSVEFAIARRTVQLSVNPVGTSCAETEKILILTDITDRKVAEYALRTAEKLAATGKLANAIAHEINNPLEALTNLIYLAEISPTLDATRDLLSHADTELARIARVTKQSLAFHRDSQSPVLIDVAELVADVVALLERSAAVRRVHLVCKRQPSVTISGFPGQLTQVFSNLIRNAAEASPPNSDVVIRIRSIDRRGHRGARVSIHDRGPGISEEIREKLFDPFFTTKGLKGSGLGLWVSKALVTKHQGTIRFRSSRFTNSSGTTFEVFLPLGESPQDALQIAS